MKVFNRSVSSTSFENFIFRILIVFDAPAHGIQKKITQKYLQL